MKHDLAELAAVVAILTEEYSWDANTEGGIEDVEAGFERFERLYKQSESSHSGDCTNEIHACARCEWDELMTKAREIVRRLKESVS